MFSRISLPKLLSSNTAWLERQQTSILSAAMVITVANVVSSLFGLLRERFLISTYFDNASSQQALEAFQVAFQIPDALFQLIILGALSAAFIPVFTKLKKKSQANAFKMSSIVMNSLLVLFVVIAIVVFIFAEPLTRLRTGSGFTENQILATAQLTRLMLGAQILFAISNFWTGILQSYQRFIIPALAPILYNLGIIVGVLLLHQSLGIYAAGVGVLIGAGVHMLVQLPLVIKLGYRHSFSFNFNFPGVKELFGLMPPRVLTYALIEIQTLAMGFFATSLVTLSFFSLRLGMRLMSIPIRLFGVPIGQASLAFLSEKNDDLNRFRTLLVQSMHQVTFMALPAAILLLILRVPIVRLVFGTHNLPWVTTVGISRLVALLAISVVAQALVQLMIRSFHAMEDTWTPFGITAATVGLWTVGNLIGIFVLGQGIMAMAIVTSLAAFFELLLFVLFMHHKLGKLINRSLIIPQLKMLLAGFLMAIFLYLPFRIFDELVFDTSRTVDLLGLTVTTATIGILVYTYFAALLDISQLQLYTGVLQKISSRWQKPLAKSTEVMVEASGDE